MPGSTSDVFSSSWGIAEELSSGLVGCGSLQLQQQLPTHAVGEVTDSLGLGELAPGVGFIEDVINETHLLQVSSSPLQGLTGAWHQLRLHGHVLTRLCTACSCCHELCCVVRWGGMGWGFLCTALDERLATMCSAAGLVTQRLLTSGAVACPALSRLVQSWVRRQHVEPWLHVRLAGQ